MVRYSPPPLQCISGVLGKVQAGGPGPVDSGSLSATVLEGCGALSEADLTEVGAATGLQLMVGTGMVHGAGTSRVQRAATGLQ